MESYELLITLGLIVLYWNNGIVANDTQSMCPNVLPMVLSGYVPRGLLCYYYIDVISG